MFGGKTNCFTNSTLQTPKSSFFDFCYRVTMFGAPWRSAYHNWCFLALCSPYLVMDMKKLTETEPPATNRRIHNSPSLLPEATTKKQLKN